MATHGMLNLFVVVVLATSAITTTGRKLSPNYYRSTCPRASAIVRAGVVKAVKKETRMGASLLRLHFHDCFVTGCDASLLLDDTPNFVGEKRAIPNNTVRGYKVIDHIKARLEKACPGVVSCADIVALAARDSVVHLGGPSWKVSLGRRDSTTASAALVHTALPGATFNLSALIATFSAQGLSVKNMVALAGSHTIGLARCASFRGRIYNDSNIKASFAHELQKKCPKVGNDSVTQGLDIQTPTLFDNFYFKNLLRKKGLLHSDQALFNGGSADPLVKKYARHSKAFFRDFARAMIKMSKIKPPKGSNGQIRKNCRKVNRV